MDNTMKTSTKIPKKKLLKRITLIVAILLVLGAAGTFIYLQYRSLKDAESEKNNLTTQVKDLKSDNNKLTDTNTSLKKSIEALANQKNTQTTTSGSSSSTPQVSVNSGILTLKGGNVLTPSYYGNTGTNADTDQLNALFITIKNTSTTSKQFILLDFSAITDKGEIVKPLVYAGPLSGNFWNNSTLAPNGSTDQSIVFDPKYTLVSLQWAPPGFEITSLPIPSKTASPAFWSYSE